jgi:transmembrane sensor
LEPVSDGNDLFAAVRREQDAWAERVAPPGATRLRLENAVETLPAARPARRRWLLASAAAAVVAVAACVLLWPRPPEPLSFRVGSALHAGVAGVWLSAPAAERLPLQFSDGSKVVLKPLCRARVATTEARGAAIVVESGRVEVDVVHRPEGRWRLSLGPYSVHVVGTRFGVEFDPATESLRLEVHEGRVVASGCHLGEGRPIHAGERLQASCKTRQLEIVAGQPERASQPAAPRTRAVPETETLPPHSPIRPETGSAPATTADVPRAPASWRHLLARGDYKGGFSAAKAAGFERECESSSSAELIALGDAARFSGQSAAAEHAYLTLRRRFPGDGRAALAAFSLARIAFDQRGAHSAAARWFETYLRESPSGPLAREARGRLMESLQRSGQTERARTVAEQYMTRHPRGPHAELARRLLAE